MNQKLYNAERAAGLTILVLMGFGIVQVIMGETVARSVALTANGIDCIGDGFVSLIVWVGLRFFKRSPDSKFHYGYYKIENLASVGAAMVMMGLASYIVYRAYMQLVNPHPVSVPLLGAVVALLAALVAWGMGIEKYMRGKRMGLSSLKLDAINTIKDGTSSFLAVIALVVSARGYPVADAVAGFVIAAIIVSIGFATVKEASFVLVDACDADCFLKRQEIQAIAEGVSGVEKGRVARLRRTGPVIQGEIEIEVPEGMTVKEVHEIRTQIQNLVKDRFSDMEHLTVVAVPRLSDSEPDSTCPAPP